jgi:hypothetical protein
VDGFESNRKPLLPAKIVLALVAITTIIPGCGGSPAHRARASEGTSIATIQRATSVAALGSHVVWSTYDSRRDVYRLTQRFEGKTSFLPVAPRRIPFDLDLGLDAHGHVLATYSRCKHESRAPDGAGDLPDYTRGRGCDIYAFDFQRQGESKIEGASSRTASEYLPTISHSRSRTGAPRSFVAFGRSYDERRGRRGLYKLSRLPYLYVRPLVGRGRSRRLPGGPRGRLGGPGPGRLDLDGHHLAFDWTYFPLKSGTRLFQIRFASTLTRVRRVLDETGYTSGELNASFLVAPTISGGNVYWLRRNDGEDGDYGSVFRYSIAERRCLTSTERPEPGPISLALDGALTYYVQRSSTGSPRSLSSYDVYSDSHGYNFSPAACGRVPR